jgi:hypothetical protein
MPIDGKIVLRPPKADTKSPEVQGAQRAIRDEKRPAQRRSPREVATVDATGFCQAHLNCAAGPASVKRASLLFELRSSVSALRANSAPQSN